MRHFLRCTRHFRYSLLTHTFQVQFVNTHTFQVQFQQTHFKNNFNTHTFQVQFQQTHFRHSCHTHRHISSTVSTHTFQLRISKKRYSVDYSKADTFAENAHLGVNQGCQFTETSCQNIQQQYPEYFCSAEQDRANENICARDFLSVTQCSTDVNSGKSFSLVNRLADGCYNLHAKGKTNVNYNCQDKYLNAVVNDENNNFNEIKRNYHGEFLVLIRGVCNQILAGSLVT